MMSAIFLYLVNIQANTTALKGEEAVLASCWHWEKNKAMVIINIDPQIPKEILQKLFAVFYNADFHNHMNFWAGN
jgi:hypothetical protein